MQRAALSACLCIALLAGLGGPASAQTTPRIEMQALVDAEAPSGARRSQMILAFNRGFNVFQQSYRTCTPPAEVAIRRYLEEGAKISREITVRYSN